MTGHSAILGFKLDEAWQKLRVYEPRTEDGRACRRVGTENACRVLA